ncbi:hypothetical protein ACTOB_003041 [Actinoplanes oblitus]|uniref:Uncharacterized protein n=1 Tax=Actinoplanes oblitus TaxID=3040509 RepID=A0ABY8WU73_9ACTN|nr:hypothetical protein [Actinoplanes oblitus]WIM99390.1 hypothetical protein ACTOB_003041 [Actinoplanes oblitus]
MIEQYDFTKLRVERQISTGEWKEIPTANFTYTANVDPDENDVFLFGSETATSSVTRYSTTTNSSVYAPWNVGDKIRCRYVDRSGTSHIVSGSYFIVDTVKVTRTQGISPKTWRYDFSCTMVGKYALAASKVVCYPDLPKESAYKRLSRFVTITNLVMTESESEVEVLADGS